MKLHNRFFAIFCNFLVSTVSVIPHRSLIRVIELLILIMRNSLSELIAYAKQLCWFCHLMETNFVIFFCFSLFQLFLIDH